MTYSAETGGRYHRATTRLEPSCADGLAAETAQEVERGRGTKMVEYRRIAATRSSRHGVNPSRRGRGFRDVMAVMAWLSTRPSRPAARESRQHGDERVDVGAGVVQGE
jgi:hypothetical protein